MNINNCLASFQFIGNSIQHLCVQNNFVFLSEEDWKNSDTNIDIKYSVEEIIPEEDKMLGVINLYLVLNIAHENRKLNVELTVQGCFGSEIQPEEDFRQQLSVNGCTVLYSISRSILTSILAQCFSGHHIMLPMINVFDMVKDEQKKDK